MSKPHLVMIPGFMCDERLFSAQCTGLTRRCVPQVILPSSDACTIRDMAMSILDRAPPRFALIGLSMGGIVAMEILRVAAHRIEALMLWDTIARPDPPEKQDIRRVHIKAVKAGSLQEIMREYHIPTYAGIADDPSLVGLCADMAQTLGPRSFVNHTRALMSRPDQRAWLGKITVPTLIACGAEDRLCPPECHAEMQARIPGARFHMIDDAGHLPPLQAPEETTALIANFL